MFRNASIAETGDGGREGKEKMDHFAARVIHGAGSVVCQTDCEMKVTRLTFNTSLIICSVPHSDRF